MKKLATGSLFLIATLVFAVAAIGQMGGGLQMPTPQGIFNPVVGAGAQYNVVNKNGTKMNVELAIVGQESSGGKDGYWYETTADTDRGAVSVKMLLVPNGNSSSITKTIVMIPGRGPMEMDGMMGGRMAQNQQPKDIRDDAKNVGSESVTVPAGTFTCDHWKGNDGSDVWVTKGVPPYGLVKMTQQDGSTVVLAKVLTNYQDKITGTPMNMSDMMRGMGRGPQQ